MKKLPLIFSLYLLLIFTGCGNPFAVQYCENMVGPANASYRINYPCVVTSTNPCYGPGDIATGTVGADGKFRVRKQGFSCDYLQSIARFGTNLGVTLSASPASVYLPTPPASGTITGHSFDATYGMPQVEYFDSNGYLVGLVSATSVLSGGTSLQANLPDLSYVYSGTYQVRVTNKTYDGYYLNRVGSATMSGWGRDRPDSDGDGWYDDEDCDPGDPSRNYDCSNTCGGGYNNETGYHEFETICQY